MGATVKIAVSLPGDLLESVESERKASGESRSQFFRRAVISLLRQKRDLEIADHYIKAYRAQPETPREIEAARRTAADGLGGEPW